MFLDWRHSIRSHCRWRRYRNCHSAHTSRSKSTKSKLWKHLYQCQINTPLFLFRKTIKENHIFISRMAFKKNINFIFNYHKWATKIPLGLEKTLRIFKLKVSRFFSHLGLLCHLNIIISYLHNFDIIFSLLKPALNSLMYFNKNRKIYSFHISLRMSSFYQFACSKGSYCCTRGKFE